MRVREAMGYASGLGCCLIALMAGCGNSGAGAADGGDSNPPPSGDCPSDRSPGRCDPSGVCPATTLAVGSAPGADFGCAVLSDGTVKCWQDSSYANTSSVLSVTSATAVAAGRGQGWACAVLSNGRAECWGDESHLGNGAVCFDQPGIPSGLGPVFVSGISNAMAIGAGVEDTCVLLASGAVKCWGLELGSPALTNAQALSVGYGFACVVLADKSVQCWGDDSHGALGNGTVVQSALPPVAVSNLSDVTMVSCGDYHACALRSGGGVVCWGDNSGGQLGDGTTAASSTPVQVSGLSGVVAIGTGPSRTCAITSGGTVECWGAGATLDGGDSPTPVVIPGLPAASAIAAAEFMTCVLLKDGSVQCWDPGLSPPTPVSL